MAMTYYCGVGRTSSTLSSRTEAERERDRHRDDVHQGRIPDGEWIRHVKRETFNYGSFGRGVAIFLSLPIIDWIGRHR